MVWAVLGCVVVLGGVMLGEVSATDCAPGSIHDLTDSPAGVHWHEDLETGWQESRRFNLPMVIFITQDQCHYCQAMKRDTWCDTSVRRHLASGFVAIRLTPQENARVLNRINVKTYPMTLIGLPQGKIVDHRTGYQPPQIMERLLSQVRKRRQ